ncbi:MAG: winged helix DNA-binding domain-containing protein [Angustibacter sp.]
MSLTAADGLRMRMRSLLLVTGSAEPGGGGSTGGDRSGVGDVVTWFGAMQAQDYASGLWSLGARLPGLTRGDVEAVLERGEALRTWPMRGTIHLVPGRDARWMLELTGVRALAGAEKRRAYLGLSKADADRAVEVLGSALADRGRMTRAECVDALTAAGIAAAGNYAYHLLWYASQRGVTCIGPNQGAEQTFTLLDELAPEQAAPDADEALATLAVRYFRSHGPTTRQDFAGWTGLPMADVRRAIALAGAELAAVEVEGREMYVGPSAAEAVDPVVSDDLLVLPGFDEYLLGYKDRSWMVAAEHMGAIVPGGNGVFQATVVRDGRVVATWKRSLTKTRVTVSVTPLTRLGRQDRDRVEAAFVPYGAFLEVPLRLTWVQT